MRDEALCAEIFRQVVNAVEIPVTVKMRTGWDHQSKNGPVIAKMAQDLGLQAVTMHGRTRCDMYKGGAEYDTIRRTRDAVQIPLIANGDITSTDKARGCLSGHWRRCGNGRSWDSRRSVAARNHCSRTQRAEQYLDPLSRSRLQTMAELIREIQLFYGENTGVKMARKHMQWFLKRFANGAEAWSQLHPIVDPDLQYQQFKELIDGGGLRDGIEGTG